MHFSEKYIFGTAKIHHLVSRHRLYKILDTAYDVGFRMFDTSPYYGLGLNERILILWVKSRKHTDVRIHTKIGLSYPLWRSTTIFEYAIQKALLTLGLCSVINTKARTKIYKEHDLVPNMLFIHEPGILKKSDLLKLSSAKSVDGVVIDGYAGRLTNVELNIEGNVYYQVPFADYPNGDVFYGIFSGGSKVFSPSLEGRFIYATNKVSRLKNFADGKL